MFWIRHPLLRPLCLLSAGILLGEYGPDTFIDPWWLLLCAGVFFLLLFRFSVFFCWLAWILLGYGLCAATGNHNDRPLPGEGVIVIRESSYTSSDRWRRYLGVVQCRRQSESWYRERRKILVYLPKSVRLSPGSRLVFRGKIICPDPPLHEGIFDYRRYLRFQGIDGMVFLNKGQYALLEPENNLRHRVERLRHDIRQKIHRWLPDPVHARLLTGMVLGEKRGLDPEIRKVFSVTGSMHVLAVSGLHVGLIYFLVLIPLSIFSRRGAWPWLRWILLLLSLFFYAALAGFTPSVVRAVVFILLFLFSKLTRRPNPLSHVLMLTALLMLLVDPFQLFRLSFQLSFLAVLGILLFMPLLERIFSHKYKAADYLLKNMGLSVAVQLATLPLTVLYFRQLSLIFWLASVLVVPATFLLLILAALLFVFPSGLFLHTWTIKVISWIMASLISVLTWLSALPYSHLQHVHIPAYFLAAVPVLIFMHSRAFGKRRTGLLKWSALLTLVWCLILPVYQAWFSTGKKAALFFHRENGWHVLSTAGESGQVWRTGLCKSEAGCEDAISWLRAQGAVKINKRKMPESGADTTMVKIGRVMMVFWPKSDNFPITRTVSVTGTDGRTDTLQSISGRALFHEIPISDERYCSL